MNERRRALLEERYNLVERLRVTLNPSDRRGIEMELEALRERLRGLGVAEDDEVADFRSRERARTAPMREAARKEAFVQGWIAGKFGDPSQYTDQQILDQLPQADAAYKAFVKLRSPA